MNKASMLVVNLFLDAYFLCVYFQGKAGSVPSAEELTEALQNHDLFLYIGHGSGMMIP